VFWGVSFEAGDVVNVNVGGAGSGGANGVTVGAAGKIGYFPVE
jgi:hypothetical protein